MPLPEKFAASLIGIKHPSWTENREIWEDNEIFFRGSKKVYDALKKFTWETENPALYSDRQAEATYINFPNLMTEKMNGTLFSQSPVPNLGNLGVISDDGSIETRADLIMNATDGVGGEARSWDSFWDDCMSMAPATSFRWIFVEAPPEASVTEADEFNRGLRPYVIEWSPTQVPMWKHSDGRLDWCYVVLEVEEIEMKGEEVIMNKKKHFYIMIRDEYKGFGDVVPNGGWWIVDEDGKPVTDEAGNPMEGTWEKTAGQIPMTRLYYEQGRIDKEPEGLNELVRLSKKYMNHWAALDNDVWVSGSRKMLLLGTDPAQFNTIVQEGKAGGMWIPVPTGRGGSTPEVYDTGSATASEAIITAMNMTLDIVNTYMMRELTTSPDASGEARRIEMKTGKAPRLAHMAANLEEAQREVIAFLEMRWGFPEPAGSVTWPKTFDLRSIAEKIDQALEIMRKSETSSPTLVSNLVSDAVVDLGVLPDDEDNAEGKTVMDVIKEELHGSAVAAMQHSQLLSTMLSPGGFGGAQQGQQQSEQDPEA